MSRALGGRTWRAGTVYEVLFVLDVHLHDPAFGVLWLAPRLRPPVDGEVPASTARVQFVCMSVTACLLPR